MNDFEILIALLLYLLFFGWIGVRRGTAAELVVLVVAIFLWVGLQAFGDTLISVLNLVGKVLQAVLVGQFDTENLDAIAALPDIITAQNRRGYLFLFYGLGLLLAYIGSSQFVKRDRLGNPGWAFLTGLANAIVFASILLPRLITLVLPDVDGVITFGNGITLDSLTERVDVLGVLASGIRIIIGSLSELWVAIRPQAEWVLLILFTLILVLAASTLRPASGSSRSSSSSSSSS